MRRFVCMLTCVFMLVAVGYAGTVPATIYDTITGDPTSGLTPVTFSPYYNGLAASFSTIPQLFTLTEVDLVLGPQLLTEQPAVAGGLNIFLFSDLGTVPNANLATIGSISDAAITGTGTYSWSGLNIALATSTRYWIGVFPTGGTTSRWGLTAPAPVSAQGQYLYDTADGSLRNVSSALQMRIMGNETVPEPSTMFLAAFGMSALVMWRRRSAAR
jgi:hypothetical protein